MLIILEVIIIGTIGPLLGVGLLVLLDKAFGLNWLD